MPRCGCVTELFVDEFVVWVFVMQDVLILALVTGLETDIEVTGVLVDVLLFLLLILWTRVVGLVDLRRRGDGSQVPLTSQLFLQFFTETKILCLISNYCNC